MVLRIGRKTHVPHKFFCVSRARRRVVWPRAMASAPRSSVCTPLQPHAAAVNTMAGAQDMSTRVMLLSTAKAGATLVLRLMFAHLNLTAEALAYGNYTHYPLKYGHDTFDKQPGRTPPRSIESLRVCASSRWTCIAIVRSPMDRAVSSYIHSMTIFHRNGHHFGELREAACGKSNHNWAPPCLMNASFRTFVKALELRAHRGTRSPSDNHFMPQAKAGFSMPGVLMVPIESLPGAYSCPPWDRVHPERLALLEPPAPLKHYKVHNESAVVNDPLDWEWPRLKAAVDAHATPPYSSFFSNATFCREAIGCTLRRDLELYARMCSQPWIDTCAPSRAACDKEMQRWRNLCGIDLTELLHAATTTTTRAAAAAAAATATNSADSLPPPPPSSKLPSRSQSPHHEPPHEEKDMRPAASSHLTSTTGQKAQTAKPSPAPPH